jgi:hypothetical protein
MSESGDQKSFWATLPGILTAIAAVIGAIGGLIGGLAAAGLIEVSQPDHTPDTTPALPMPALPAPDPYIPSLKAHVTALRFFESGISAPELKDRLYKHRFDSKTSRYIYWELNLEHPKPERHIDFSITAIYYRYNGTSLEEVCQRIFYAHLEKDWPNSHHTLECGAAGIGSWEIGYHRVDLYVDGKKVASGQFEIY